MMKVIKTIEIEVPDLHLKVKKLLKRVENVSQAFLGAGLPVSPIYGLTKKSKLAVQLNTLEEYLKPLGCTPAELGVVFQNERQVLQPPGSTPVGESVLGAYWDKDERRYLFVDVILQEDDWSDCWGEAIRTPDGWLPLPVVEVPGDGPKS